MGEPAWSPDGSLMPSQVGTKAATTTCTRSSRTAAIGNSCCENAWSPSWSPDGKRLVVVRGACLAPYTCDEDLERGRHSRHGRRGRKRCPGADVRQGEGVWRRRRARVVPDGKWIAFFGGDGAVNARQPKRRGRRRPDDPRWAAGQWNLAWSPDASKLAFDTADKAHDYRQEIAVFDLATKRLTTVPSRSARPRPRPGLRTASSSHSSRAGRCRRAPRLRRRDADGSVDHGRRREQSPPAEQGQLRRALVGDVSAGAEAERPAGADTQRPAEADTERPAEADH